jgi:hypothetical protein
MATIRKIRQKPRTLDERIQELEERAVILLLAYHAKTRKGGK